MSKESSSGNPITGAIWFLSFWGFIAAKMGGTVFAAWSWWWVLLPIVPWISLAVKRMGL